MGTLSKIHDLKRDLVRLGVDLDKLPPFAITEEEFADLTKYLPQFLMLQEIDGAIERGYYEIAGIKFLKGSLF